MLPKLPPISSSRIRASASEPRSHFGGSMGIGFRVEPTSRAIVFVSDARYSRARKTFDSFGGRGPLQMYSNEKSGGSGTVRSSLALTSHLLGLSAKTSRSFNNSELES